MMFGRMPRYGLLTLAGVVLLSVVALDISLPGGSVQAEGLLIVDGDFEWNEDGNQLRRRESDQG